MIKFTDIDGLKIRYRETGEGKTIVFLHGWGCSLDIFKTIHTSIANNGFKAITLDFPGFGESSEPKNVWGVYEYADFFEKFVRKLQIKDPTLVGHSFGGRVSIIYASRNENLSKLILVDAAGIKPKRSLKYYYKVYSFKTMKHIVNFILPKDKANQIIDNYRKKSGSSDYNGASIMMRSILSKVVNQDLKYLLPKIKVPTLLFWGKNDTATPIKDAQIMNKLIPDSGLIAYDNVGHFSFLERGAEFDAVIKNFLKN
ncbi:MAG: alpha/beta hydrolase [Bacteroidales bacterium]|nr:alpha/beta hydrolase [Bacteroidales bacterium]